MHLRQTMIPSIAVAVAMTVAGCGEATESGAASAPSQSASAVPSTPPPSAPAGNKLGEAIPFDENTSTITFYGYKHNATQFGKPSDSAYVYGAIDLKYCLKKLPKGYSAVSIGTSNWVLKFGDASFKSTGHAGGNGMKPEYPDRKEIKVGTCVRGWLEFKVPKDGKPTAVEYTPAGAPEPITWTP
ncbi:hypothetical protein [Micromonospora sp. NPDC005367]|uniref:hypothetical protein n=1 Tax=Micromonospora sp. NPDC005367 TaxID=3155590 RepID=UPI0033BB8262